MKRILTIFICFLAIVLNSCSEITPVENKVKGLTIIATNNATPSVKTTYTIKDDGLSLTQRWAAGDIIGVGRKYSSGAQIPFTQCGDLSNDGHTAKFHSDDVSFSVGNPIFAAYPYSANSQYDISTQSGKLTDLSNCLILDGEGIIEENGMANLSFSSRCVIFRLVAGILVTTSSYSGDIELYLSGPAVCTELNIANSFKPLTQGTITVSTRVVNGRLEEDVYIVFLLKQDEELEFLLTSDKGDRYVLNRNSLDANKVYRISSLDSFRNIVFRDNTTKSICVGNWDTDGDNELSYVEAAKVTSISNAFPWNNGMEYFDEFRFFVGVTSLGVLNYEGTGTNTGSFSLCDNLKSIRLPRTLKELGGNAFYYCPELTTVEIPSGANLYTNPFNYCPKIEGFIIDGKNAGRILYHNIIISGVQQYREIVAIAPAGLASIEVQSLYGASNSVLSIRSRVLTGDNENFTGIQIGICSLRSIANSAFSNYSHLRNVFLYYEDESSYATSALSYIGNYAFNYSGINTFSIPASVKTIGDGCFRGCSNLSTLYFDNPSQISIIPESFCEHCSSLNTITLPASVTQIKNNAFSDCSSLTSINLAGTTPPTLFGNPFNYTNCTFYVPSSALSTYKSNSSWSAYASRIVGY